MSKAAKSVEQKPVSVHTSSTIANDMDMEDLEAEEDDDGNASKSHVPSQFSRVPNPEVELPIEDLVIEDDEDDNEAVQDTIKTEDWIRFLISMSKSSSQYTDLLASLTLAERKDTSNIPWQAVSEIEPFQLEEENDGNEDGSSFVIES